MRIIDLLTNLDISARFFIAKNPDPENEALLVDFINFIGARCRVYYGMYTSDLKNDINISELTAWNLETLGWVTVQATEYITFARESVILNKHMNETNGVFNMSQAEIENVINEFVRGLK